MRVVIQRVKEASVTINGQVKSKINRGLLVLLGINNEDGQEDTEDEVEEDSKHSTN